MTATKPIRYMIVDDEKLGRDLLESMAAEEPGLQLLGKCRSASEAKTILEAGPVDLIFLDIQMPLQSGLDFLRDVKPNALVVLVTAFPDFALEGFELAVTDYLLKPVTETRFAVAMQRVRAEWELKNKAKAFESIHSAQDTFLTFKSGYDDFRLTLNEIMYIESDGEYLRIHTEDRSFMTLGALKKLEEDLPKSRFRRVHRSYLVPLDRVKGRVGNHLQLENGKLIPVSRSYREVIKDLF